MLKSYVIDIQGVFMGAAVCCGDGYRFVATDARLGKINGRKYGTLGDVRRNVRLGLMSTPQLAPEPADAD